MGLLNKQENNKNKKNDSKVKKTIKKQLTTFAVTIGLKILPLLLVAAIIISIINWIVKIFESKNTVDAIYESLEIDDVYDLVQIKGNDTDGYYLDFVDGIDDKLDNTINYLNDTAGMKSGADREFLKKLIKAEIYTQFPDLGGNIGTSSGFQGAVNIVRITPNKEINSLTNTGAGQETIINQDENNSIEITNKEEISKQEEIIKNWSEGKELTIGATALVYSQEESRLNPGEKIDYWVPQKSEKTQRDLKISENETVTYTGNYSISVNKMTNEGLIYVEIEKDDIKGYVKYSYILKDSDEGNSNNVIDDEFVDSGYVEQSEEKIVDTIDSNVYKLVYIPKEKFDEYMTNADKNILNYFTLDDGGNLITAQWEAKEDGTLELKNNSTINLKSALRNLVMPYAYLMYFYINADYKDFSSDLADEVLNSKIIVAVEYNITTSYTKKTIEEKKVSQLSEFSYDWTEKNSTETTTEYCNTKVEVIYADTWCVKMVNEDIYNEELLNVSVGQAKNMKLPGKVTETTSNSISEETMSEEGNDTKEETETYVDSDGKTKTRKVTKKIPYKKYEHTITDNHGISNSYASSNEEKEPESKENIFVNLYKKHQMYNRLSEKRLLKILERDSRTSNLVNLTKYLMNMATGNNYDDVLEFDFSEFFNINNITLGSGGASYKSLNLTDSDLEILYKITSAERGGGTQEQQEYVVSVILNRVLSSQFPDTVYDVVFAPMQFQPTRNGAYEAAKPSDTTIAAVNNVIATGDKSQCAVYFMTPAASLSQSWLSNCEFLFNDTNDSLKDTNTGGSHNFYTTQAIKEELQQYMTGGNGSVVETAISIHRYVRENDYKYDQAGIIVPNINGSTIDCSSYVTWVLVNAGVGGFTEGMYQWSSDTFNRNPCGWEEVSVQDAQPGDILVYNGHVEIVADIGTDKFIVYNCGSDKSIKAVGSTDLPESSTSGRLKSTILKILRVP